MVKSRVRLTDIRHAMTTNCTKVGLTDIVI